MGMIETRPFKVLIASLVFLLVGQVLHHIGVFVSRGYYSHPDYYFLWNPLMISLTDAGGGANFIVTSIALGFISALLFVIVYTVVGRGFEGGGEKGIHYGLLIFIVATIPYSFSMFVLLDIPEIIITLWAFQSLVLYVIGGLLTGIILEKKIDKPKKNKGETKAEQRQKETNKQLQKIEKDLSWFDRRRKKKNR
jgi:hypothetical protein